MHRINLYFDNLNYACIISVYHKTKIERFLFHDGTGKNIGKKTFQKFIKLEAKALQAMPFHINDEMS